MTKMPEPIEYLRNEQGYRTEGLITTTQAEAYANERVREVLEQVLKLVEAEMLETCDDDHQLGWSDCAYGLHKSISQLIPKEQS